MDEQALGNEVERIRLSVILVAKEKLNTWNLTYSVKPYFFMPIKSECRNKKL